MRYIKYIIFIILVIFIHSCISDFNPKIPDNLERILVVEGDIISDTIVEFWFSQSLPLNFMGEISDTEIQVDLYIINDEGYRSEKAKYLGDGCHQITVPELKQNTSYAVEFIYEGQTYQSSFIKPVINPGIESITFHQSRDFADVQIRINTTASSEPAYFIWDYKEDWEFSVTYSVPVFYNAADSQYYEYPYPIRYYCWNAYTNKDIIVGSTEKLTENRLINNTLYQRLSSSKRFSLLYSSCIKQQALSKAAYEYYLDLQKSNAEMGGLFTPQPSSIEGNIKCINDPNKKVIGFVDVSDKIIEKQIYINNYEITRSNIINCGIITDNEAKSRMSEAEISEHEFIASGYHPVKYSKDEDPEIWVYTFCLDCIYDGGTKNKPENWPNDHQ